MSPRQQRAAALIGTAAMVIVLTAALYLRSSGGAVPKSSGHAIPDRSILSGVSVMYDFVTPSVGWAIESPIEPASALAVFKTTDGAKHWGQQLLQRTSSPEPVEFQMQFIDQTHGFVAAGAPFGLLYATSDGGRTWASAALPPPALRFDAISFTDPMHGWLLGRVNQRPAFYATNNAGSSWYAGSTPGDASGLSFRDNNEGWLGSFSSDVPHVYVSADGGATWQQHHLPSPPGITWDSGASNGRPLITTAIQVLPQQGAVAIVDNGSGSKYEFTSFDLGATWRFVPTPPGRVGYEDSTHWWAMQGSSLFKSADAGQTWTEITNVLQIANGLPDWQATPEIIDRTHAWTQVVVEGGYGLAGTTDGGMHWARGHVPIVN